MSKCIEYLKEDMPAYIAFLDKNPKIKEAVTVSMIKAQNSMFHGRIDWDLMVCTDFVHIWPGITYSLSNVNKVNAYRRIYCKLMEELSSSHDTKECDLSGLLPS
jgi:hypothetical protein